MSFFKNKSIIVQVRGVSLNFNLISKKEIANMELYGKINDEMAQENPGIIRQASQEILNLLVKKLIKKDDETLPTADELEDLTNDELVDIINKVTGSSESIKQALNRR